MALIALKALFALWPSESAGNETIWQDREGRAGHDKQSACHQLHCDHTASFTIHEHTALYEGTLQ